MFKRLKVLVAMSLLLVGCSKMPLLNNDSFMFSSESKYGKLDKESLEREIKRQQGIEQNSVNSQKVNSENLPFEEKILEEKVTTENSKQDEIVQEDVVEDVDDNGNVEEEVIEETVVDKPVVQKPVEKPKQSKVEETKLNLKDNLKNSNISYYAVDLKTGKVLANYRGENVAIPASVMKIVTSATALEVLGEDTRLETKVLYDGKINKGVLNGDIYIQGGGDPTLGSDGFKGNREAFIDTWVNAVKKAGIKSINGEIIVIDNLFGYDGVLGKWLLEDLASGYGQAVYGISVFDNTTNVFLSSNSNSTKVEKIKPSVKNLTFENHLKISPKGKNDIYVRGVPFENRRFLVGEMAKNIKMTSIKTDIPDPGMFLGEYFKEKLEQSGIDVKGKVKTARTTPKRAKNAKVLIVTKSKTIGEIVKVLLTRSDNHYTEHLYQLIKLKNVDINEYWAKKGINTKALEMYDGSGLSRSNNLTAKTLVDILVYMYKNHPQYVNLLPRAGYEGTVVGFLPKSRFKGVAKVKSGSMGGVQSYAGYAEQGNKKIAFAILINHWTGSRRSVKNEMEKMVKNLF